MLPALTAPIWSRQNRVQKMSILDKCAPVQQGPHRRFAREHLQGVGDRAAACAGPERRAATHRNPVLRFLSQTCRWGGIAKFK